MITETRLSYRHGVSIIQFLSRGSYFIKMNIQVKSFEAFKMLESSKLGRVVTVKYEFSTSAR